MAKVVVEMNVSEAMEMRAILDTAIARRRSELRRSGSDGSQLDEDLDRLSLLRMLFA